MSSIKYEIRGNLLILQQYPLHLYYDLRKVFSYDRIGYDRKLQQRTRTPEIVGTGFNADGASINLTDTAIPKTIVTFHGYEYALLKFAAKNKIHVDKIVTKLTDETVYVPQWDKLPEDFEFRYMQKEILETMANNTGGIIVAATGFGKGEIAGIMPLVFPQARILMCSFRQQVYSTLADRVRKYVLPSTKLFIQKPGKSVTQSAVQQARIVVCGNKSLPKILGYSDDYDFVILDEVHTAATNDTFRIVSSLIKPRIFGFTASPNRADGGQFRLLGLCGPKLMEIDMKKAVEKGLVVPVKVKWCPVDLQYDPTAKCHIAYKKHRGIWYNAVRNKLIAGAALTYDADTQVLIIVETIKHAFALKAMLPEYKVISSETPDLDRSRNAFKKGTLKKVISTGVWKEGVDFPSLTVLINATGVKSEISNIQLTGRVSRTDKDKTQGTIYDFYDNWNYEFKYFASERKKLYDKQGYTQEEVTPTELLKNIV